MKYSDFHILGIRLTQPPAVEFHFEWQFNLQLSMDG
jgi:hypothetical protein